LPVIRVLLVDDQPLVRAGLRRILRPRAGFEVVGECDDGDQVDQAVAATGADVVVMDVRMKRVDGAEATRRLRSRAGSPPVLVLTTFDEDEVLSAALRAGANGFLLKDASGAELVKAVKTVAEGGAYLDLAVTHRVLAAFGADTRPALRAPDAALTPRELEVLKLVGRGLANGEIARELYISEVTVKAHLGHVLTKLNLRDRAAAIVYAFDTGLATPGG
jgi:DNA-binding NarL/FixJ family response regulator